MTSYFRAGVFCYKRPMRSAVALVLASSLAAGCFPHSRRNTTISEIIEGGIAISGVVVEGFVQSGADCNQMVTAPGAPKAQCASNASTGGGIGVALILAGVVGFIATISAFEDDVANSTPPVIEIKAPPPAPPAKPPATDPAPPAPAPTVTPAT